MFNNIGKAGKISHLMKSQITQKFSLIKRATKYLPLFFIN